MPYPDPPEIATSYTAIEQSVGDGSLPGQEIDVDLAALRQSISDVITFLRTFTRSDGKLANGSVTADTLASDILLGVSPPAPWETAQPYASPDTVFFGNRFYIATSAHTSSVFATDLAAGRWALLADFVPPGGGLLAANNLSDLTDSAAARTNLLLGTAAQAVLGTGASEIRTNSQNSAVFQPLNANLTAEAGLSGAADQLSYYTGAGAKGLTTLTAFARSLLAAATAASARSALSLGGLATLSSITASEVAGSTLVTEADSIASNDNDTTIPTSAAVNDHVVKATVGGTPQLVTGSRDFATTYPNTTGRPIFVVVTLVGNGAAGSAEALLGPTTGGLVPHIGTSCSAGSVQSTLNFIVPAGWHYRVNVVSGLLSITYWHEHRN